MQKLQENQGGDPRSQQVIIPTLPISLTIELEWCLENKHKCVQSHQL